MESSEIAEVDDFVISGCTRCATSQDGERFCFTADLSFYTEEENCHYASVAAQAQATMHDLMPADEG